MPHITDIKPSKVSRMGEEAIGAWVETVVTRMGIPIGSVSESTDQHDAEVVLSGDYEHCRVSFARGSYAVWAFNPFRGEDHIIDGEGNLHDELLQAKKISNDTEGL